MDRVDLKTLAKCTDIPVRRLRYVLDHGLLPGGAHYSQGHRVTRQFLLFEGFGIAIAAKMLVGGVRRDVIASTLTVLCRETSARSIGDVPLFRAFVATGDTHLQVIDGAFLRLMIGGTNGSWNSGWVDLSSGDRTDEPAPGLTISMDLAPLRDRLRPLHR